MDLYYLNLYVACWLPDQCHSGCRLAALSEMKVRPGEPGFTSHVAGGGMGQEGGGRVGLVE